MTAETSRSVAVASPHTAGPPVNPAGEKSSDRRAKRGERSFHDAAVIRLGAVLCCAGGRNYSLWRHTVRRAEDLGVDAILLCPGGAGPDHVDAQQSGRVDHTYPDWAAIASWAELTRRAKLGVFVTGIDRREDIAQLAAMARAVDRISDGRIVVGISDEEHAVARSRYGKDYSRYGYPDPPLEPRRLAAALDSLELGLGNHGDAQRIPIIMSWSGESAAMPLIARHAQMWHHRHDLGTFRRANALLSAAMDALPRDRAAIARSATWPGAVSADDFVAAGVTTFMAEIHPTADRQHPDVLEEMAVWRHDVETAKGR
jgi:hypothetical protein